MKSTKKITEKKRNDFVFAGVLTFRKSIIANLNSISI